jgi:hypothetical protein
LPSVCCGVFKEQIKAKQSFGMFVRGIFQPLVEGLAGIARREFQ